MTSQDDHPGRNIAGLSIGRPAPVRCCIGAGLVLLGFAAGWWAARHFPSAAPPSYGAQAGARSIAAAAPGEKTDASGARWERRWNELANQPGAPARDNALAALLEELAAGDPLRAWEIARLPANRAQRRLFRDAVLRGWAAADPAAAGEFALAQFSGDERDTALEAVLTGAARQPESALALARQLAQQDSENTYAYGRILVRAFVERGEFGSAAWLANAAPEEFRADWQDAAYGAWARHQPEAAAQTALLIDDARMRAGALRAVVAGWAPQDPAGLAEFAVHLSPGAERSEALAQALRHWVAQDLVSAANWIAHYPSSPETDPGAAAVATSPPLVAERAETAARWAESITDPELRAQTLASVVHLWARTDADAARRFAEQNQLPWPETENAL